MRSIKGIILAGGYGTRLYPLTIGISKQLLPVYDKPMIYYPLSIFLIAQIKDILVITTKQDLLKFKRLLGSGDNFGVNISYAVQKNPNGIAESFTIGSEFIGKDNVALILGDNIFHGENISDELYKAKNNLKKGLCTIFGVQVDNPKNFGVVEFDEKKNITKIIEKPIKTQSKTVVSGLYFYTNDVIKISSNLKKSKRGEKEITDINNYYLSKNRLSLNILDKSISWMDTGTYSSLIRASKYFEEYEKKYNKKISCAEEIAYEMGYISKSHLSKIAESMKDSDYGKYLQKIIGNEI